jgi:hypothetical protein
MKKPYVVGALMLVAGFISAFLRRVHRPVTPQFIRFHRREQMARLRACVEPLRPVVVHSPKLRLERRTVGAFMTGMFHYVAIVLQSWF